MTTFKGARLDRELCSFDWSFRFEQASVVHLPKVNWDHSPLLIRCYGLVVPQHISHLKFQAAWLSHPNFKEVTEENWKENIPFS